MKLRIPLTKRDAAAAARFVNAMRQGCIDEVQVAGSNELKPADFYKVEEILRRVLAASPHLFTRKRRGLCFVCGCSFSDPCPNGCAWADPTQTLCTACVSVNPHHPDAPIPYRITELGRRTLLQKGAVSR